MSAILKSGSASLGERVRPLAGFVTHAASADPERERLAAELEELTAALATRDEAIALHAAELERAFDAGKAEGRLAGLEEAEERSAERLAVIEDAADQALSRFESGLEALEQLALLVARTCLDRMLLDSEERSAIVAELVRAQFAALKQGAAIRVQVSARDFDAPEALEALSAMAGDRGCAIQASEALAPGDCRIDLRLGTLEIGIDQQWGALRAELDQMIEAGGGG